MDRRFYFIFGLLALTGAVAIALLYAKTLDDPFHFDDRRWIEHNKGLGSATLLGYLKSPHRGISFFTFALNYRLHGLSPAPWHIVSLVLFWLCGLMLFAVMTGVLLGQKPLVAAGCVMVFLLHPIQTQAVAYVTQRMELLCGLFSLASLFFVLKGVRGAGKIRFVWYGLGLVAVALAMRSKETAWALPPVIALALWLFPPKDQTRIDRRLWFRAAFVVAALAVAFSSSFLSLKQTVTEPTQLARELSDVKPEKPIGHLTYFLTGQEVIWRSLRQFVFPNRLAIDHDVPRSQGLTDPSTLAALFGIAALLAAMVLLRKKAPATSLGIGWMLLFFAPSTTFVPLADIMVDHRTFIPFMGLFFAAGEWLSRIERERVAVAVLAVLCVPLAVASFVRLDVWGDNYTLWQDAAKKYPNLARPYNNMGIALVHKQNFSDAAALFRNAVRLAPNYHDARINLANSCVMSHDYQCAAAQYKAALDLQYQRQAAVNYCKVLAATGQTAAVESFLAAIPEPEQQAVRSAINL